MDEGVLSIVNLWVSNSPGDLVLYLGDKEMTLTGFQQLLEFLKANKNKLSVLNLKECRIGSYIEEIISFLKASSSEPVVLIIFYLSSIRIITGYQNY